MTTATIVLEVPQEFAADMANLGQVAVAEILMRGMRDWKMEHALRRYIQGGMSFQAAAELAGVPGSELALAAFALGIEPPFSEETLAEELA
jgi:predicted HTH domain antitoxin